MKDEDVFELIDEKTKSSKYSLSKNDSWDRIISFLTKIKHDPEFFKSTNDKSEPIDLTLNQGWTLHSKSTQESSKRIHGEIDENKIMKKIKEHLKSESGAKYALMFQKIENQVVVEYMLKDTGKEFVMEPF